MSSRAFLLLLLLIPGVVGAAPPMPRRPYVQNVTPTGLSLLWETARNETFTATLRSLASAVSWEQVSGPARHHEVRFEGLVPSSSYEYAISTSSGTFRAVVRTAPEGDQPFTFLVYGDTRNGHGIHKTLAQIMAFDDAEFVIHTGDFVSDGLRNDKWNQFLEYSWPLMRRLPLYPTLGNHENAFESGADNFRQIFSVPENSPYPEMVYTFTWGNSRFFVIDSNKPFIGAPQTAWLRTQLSETALDPRIRHLFVSVHHSPYSSGPHGPNQELLDSGLVDDLRRYGVDMTFSAHDHLYERGLVDGLTYIITAGGGAPIYYVKENLPTSLVTEPVHHYCRVHVDGDRVELSAWRMDGSLLDYVQLRKSDSPKGRATGIEVVNTFRRPARDAPGPPTAPPGTQKPETHGMERSRPVSLYFGTAVIFIGLAGCLFFIWRRRRRPTA
ncbi:MAG: hypothetical protein CVU65_15700 [Deltaproteobacteria bacterium HGW-Deltaproteobacteria-22]|nr:MAG: hypothetical protein CVU65_15700 [Deltaproteobacteria bacterium HGW-Deltaproteobacteria-22]